MPHQDTEIVIQHQAIKQVLDVLLVPALFVGIQVRKNVIWKPRMLAAAALCWALSGTATLGERFELARKIVAKVFRWQPSPGTTCQGFMKALRKWHTALLLVIVPRLRMLTLELSPQQTRIAGFVVIAVDGSRIELARTKSLEAAFSPQRVHTRCAAKRKKLSPKQRRKQAKAKRRAAKHQRKAAEATKAAKQSAASVEKKINSPQMWLTLLWHVTTGLPWAWRTGPSDSSERGHLQEMLPELPEKTLLTADAGFVGYDCWKEILHSGQDFLIRVGGNVKLLKSLGYAREHAGRVYLWPDAAAKKQQPPLVLRLIVIHNGKHPVYLVTNLSQTALSGRQAAEIYAARWGIELFFRTFKQTFGRRKLRSRCAEHAPLELDWSLLALWCVCLLGQRELAQRGVAPRQLSPALAIRAVQDALRDYRVRPESTADTLWSRLSLALLDDYERHSSKSSRDYPRKKSRDKISPPVITRATQQQIHAAQQLKRTTAEKRLAA